MAVTRESGRTIQVPMGVDDKLFKLLDIEGGAKVSKIQRGKPF